MCGIAGVIDLEGKRDIDRRIVERMTAALERRGPDGHGFYFEPGVGFGHRRLAIIDEAGGKQPFISTTGKTVLTYNGEIYNHHTLRKELIGKGRSLTTRSDTEVLAELLDLRGPDALPSLTGMFAFAAWSPRNETFVLARDRLGEKPVYYHLTQDGFLVFASELDALVAGGWATEQIDGTAVADYLFYGYVPDPKSIYKGIYKLPPGHYLFARRGREVGPPRPWWQVRFAPNPHMGFEDAVDDLLPLLDRTTGDQMMSDRPIAAFLSGGVDSSAVTSSMVKAASGPVTTCAMGFDDPSADERGFAKEVAPLLGTQHQEGMVAANHEPLIPALAAN